MLTQVKPRKQMMMDELLSIETFPSFRSKRPITKLSWAHNTFTSGDDRPLPGGLAKGVGKGSPAEPLITWGTKLARNIPAQNPLK